MTDQHHLISDSTKLEVTRTSRGFAVARGVDRYAAPYSIQDSSLAEEAAIWLGSDADMGGRAHLTQGMATSLIPLLQAFVATGSIAGSADAIAAPPAVDREAVKWRERWHGSEPEKGSAIVDYRGNMIAYLGGDEATHAAVTQVVAAHNAILSTLSADAIRQREGWQSIETAPRDGTWFIADGGGLDRPTPMKWCERVGAWEADSVMLEDWDQQAEGYSRPLFWFAMPDRPATPASHASGVTATTKES